MSSQSTLQTGSRSVARTNERTSPEDLLALLDDEYTQAILEAIQAEAKPARALAEECNISRPTVYRRLNTLEDAGLVKSGIRISTDGHHRSVFEATVDAFTVKIEANGLSVSVEHT